MYIYVLNYFEFTSRFFNMARYFRSFILIYTTTQLSFTSSRITYGPDPKNPSLKNYNVNGTGVIKHVKRILAFGDSITEGYTKANGPFPQFSPYTTTLEDLLNSHVVGTRFEVINEGVSGECVYTEMATRLPKVLKRYGNDLSLVIILGGTNDLRRLDCDKDVNIAYELLHLHETVHKKGIKTMAVTIPEAEETNSTLAEYDYNKYKELWELTNEKIRNYTSHSNMTLLCDLAKHYPMKTLHITDRLKHWSDNLHPTKLGYKKVAGLMFDVLQKEFKLMSVPIGRMNVHQHLNEH